MIHIFRKINDNDKFTRDRIRKIIGLQNNFRLIIAPNCKYFINSKSKTTIHDI
jgi:hypothetical protein